MSDNQNKSTIEEVRSSNFTPLETRGAKTTSKIQSKLFPLKISTRIALLNVFLYLIISISCFILVIFSLNRFNKETIDASLKEYTQEIIDEIESSNIYNNIYNRTSFSHFNDFLKNCECKRHDMYFAHIFDARGNITRNPSSPIDNYFPSTYTINIEYNTLEIKSTLQTTELIISSPTNLSKSYLFPHLKIYYMLTPLKSSNGEALFMITCYDPINERMYRKKVISTVIFVNIVAIVILLFFTKALTKAALLPLTQLANESKEINLRGSKRSLVVPQTNDEVEALGVSLNQMLSNVDEAYEQSKRFTQDASHELRIPLTVMMGNIELMEKFKDDPEIYEESFQDVKEETARMKELVESLLTISRLDKKSHNIHLKSCNVYEILESLKDEITSVNGRKITIDCPKNITIETDNMLINQCLRTLADNALKYSTKEVKLVGYTVYENDIGENTNSRNELKKELGIPSKSEYTMIGVKDFGVGIEEQEIKNITKRFYRTESAKAGDRSGSGLGLSIAASITEALGGELIIKSKLGVGTTVWIKLYQNPLI